MLPQHGPVSDGRRFPIDAVVAQIRDDNRSLAAIHRPPLSGCVSPRAARGICRLTTARAMFSDTQRHGSLVICFRSRSDRALQSGGCPSPKDSPARRICSAGWAESRPSLNSGPPHIRNCSSHPSNGIVFVIPNGGNTVDRLYLFEEFPLPFASRAPPASPGLPEWRCAASRFRSRLRIRDRRAEAPGMCASSGRSRPAGPASRAT